MGPEICYRSVDLNVFRSFILMLGVKCQNEIEREILKHCKTVNGY